MSHSPGRVEFEDGTRMWFEYNGTCDYAIPCLYDKREEMQENWRNQPYTECSCGNDEPVDIETDYGGGIAWEGRACRHCRAITDGFEPYSVEYGSGLW